MNSKLTSLLPKVQSILNDYGIDVDFLRDVYENEVGVQTLKQQGEFLDTYKVLIDNKSAGSVENYNANGIQKVRQTATIYWAYDETKEALHEGDYFKINGLIYTLKEPQNLVQYNLLYQATGVVTIDG